MQMELYRRRLFQKILDCSIDYDTGVTPDLETSGGSLWYHTATRTERLAGEYLTSGT